MYVVAKVVVFVVAASAAALVNAVVITVIVVEFPVLKFIDNPVSRISLNMVRQYRKRITYSSGFENLLWS